MQPDFSATQTGWRSAQSRANSSPPKFPGSFGFNVPILIAQNRNVIAGHGRLLACRLLGMTEVPTISLGHLSPDQIRAFVIADNKLTENSTWNEVLLGEQLKTLSEVELNFSLEATGFEMGEIVSSTIRRFSSKGRNRRFGVIA